MPEAPPFALDRVQAEKSMIAPFSVPSAPKPLPRSLRPRRRKTPGSPFPCDPDCCYLYVDGSYEPAAEDSSETCDWGSYVVRANVVQGQLCSPIYCGLVPENTRVFKLSNNLAELFALVHAFEFVLSQPSNLNFMICFDSKYAAHVVQQSRQAKSHLGKLFDLLVNFIDGVMSMLKYVGTGSEVTREIWEMKLLTLLPRRSLGAVGTSGGKASDLATPAMPARHSASHPEVTMSIFILDR